MAAPPRIIPLFTGTNRKELHRWYPSISQSHLLQSHLSQSQNVDIAESPIWKQYSFLLSYHSNLCYYYYFQMFPSSECTRKKCYYYVIFCNLLVSVKMLREWLKG